MSKALLVHYKDGSKALFDGDKKIGTWDKIDTIEYIYNQVKMKLGADVELTEKTVKDGHAYTASRPKVGRPPKVKDEDES